MSNLSIKRLISVAVTAIALSGYPAFAQVFATPLPDGAGIDEVLARLEAGVTHSLNAIIPALLSAMVGFFVRADRNLPLNAVANISEHDK